MSELAVIADDLTGACDVGASFVETGLRVRVRCNGQEAGVSAQAAASEYGRGDEPIVVVNTQSRSLTPEAAYACVRDAVAGTRARLVVKKIDTALRGHLGAELDATLDALGAASAFVMPAIPAAGRVTRQGRQWFGDRPLGDTEFAMDPEGAGPESSIAVVIARESMRPSAVVSLDEVRGGDLAAVLRAHLERGTAYVVLDAETESDMALGVAALVGLPRPICVAGSIALASAIAARCHAGDSRSNETLPTASSRRQSSRGGVIPLGDAASGGIGTPALLVCGSLHSNARAQVDALVEADLATALLTDGAERDPIVTRASSLLARGRSVALSAPPAAATPARAALRATEEWLADVTSAIVATYMPRTLVLIGGETSFGILRRLGATELDVRGRFMPLVAVSEIGTGAASGVTLVTKGGSGGDAGVFVRMFGDARVVAAAAKTGGAQSCG